jgi:hypothetical protein
MLGICGCCFCGLREDSSLSGGLLIEHGSLRTLSRVSLSRLRKKLTLFARASGDDFQGRKIILQVRFLYPAARSLAATQHCILRSPCPWTWFSSIRYRRCSKRGNQRLFLSPPWRQRRLYTNDQNVQKVPFLSYPPVLESCI